MRTLSVLLLLSALIEAQVPERLYLKFNEGSGVVTADDSLLGMPGVSPVLSSANNGFWWGSALGPFCLVQYSGAPICSLQAPLAVTGDWTIEFWFKQSASSSNKSLFSDLSAGGFDLKIAGNTTVGPQDLRLLGSFGELVIEDAAITNAWVHVAIVNDTVEGTMRPYVNGQPGMPWLPTGSTDLVGVSPGYFRFPAKVDCLLDEFRIWDRALSRAEILAGMNTELAAAASDLLVSAVTSPVLVPPVTAIFGAAEAVSCEIMNVGTATIAAGGAVMMSFSVNGGTAVSEVLSLPQSLTPGDRLAFTFAATADLSALGPQTITVSAQLAGDQNPGNDARSRDFGGDNGFLINVFPWSEDFDDFPGNSAAIVDRMPRWQQENEPGGSGVSDVWGFSDSLSAPGDYAAATGVAWNSPNYIATRSPLLDLRGVSNPRLRFRILSNGTVSGSNISNFSLDVVSQPGDVITFDVLGPLGSLGPNWVDQQVDLSAFAGQVVNIRLRVAPSIPGMTANSVYVDDLLLTDHPVGNGQAPQPGLAVFDLNNAMNVGMNVPAYGEAGPYFASVTPGGPLVFSFEGGAAQPILLVNGPLNPVAATFPGIGQLDVGGPVDPTTGIPIGIGIVFDGNQPGGLNGFFVTGPSGQSSFGLTTPPLPPGPLTTFQAVLRDPATGLLVIGNAIELTVN
ncbi:MAG: hypothetical protein H6807_11450 [Planctomycetes bacterium]|nr:hypothetical protein [Planctomycetota bacterium]